MVSVKKTKIDLTISIASYNTKELLKRCLESIYQHTKDVNFEIIVVDNASKDDSALMVKKDFPQVKLIRNRVNKFYTIANNQALKLAKAKYFLILNSDIFFKTNALKKMIDYLKKNSQVGALEPLQKYEDNSLALTGSQHSSPLLDFFQFTWLGRQIKNKKLLDKYRLIRKNRTKIWSADVICDAVFLSRTKLLKQIGGFDEHLKLYYTENDLCRKIQQKGYKTVHLGNVSVSHRVSASTNKVDWNIISDIYAFDALEYYLKYHPKTSAWLLFLSMQINNMLVSLKKNPWPALLILLATWLRFYRLPELMTFIGDQGRDYLAARDFLLTAKIPLVGIPSSVPWLHQGPLFIWFIAFAFKIANFHPIAPAVLTSTLGVLTIYFTYKFSLHWFSKYYAFLTALLLTTSPLAVIHSRMPYHISPIPLFSLLFIFSLYFLYQKKTNVFWPILLWGILFNLELTTAPLIFLIPLIYWLQKQSFKKISKTLKKDRLFIISAIIIPLLPKIIYDFTHGFKQTLGFIAWFGYRLLSFFGYSGRHTVSLQSIKQTSLTIFNYWQKFISWNNLTLTIIITLIILIALIHRFLIIRKKPLIPQLIILFSFIALNLLAFFVHQGPSEAYFPVLFPAWALLIIWAFQYFKKPILSILLIILSAFNISLLVKNNFIPYGSTLKQQLIVSRFIKSNAQNQPFKLKNHQDNYRYLLWWLNTYD